MAQIAGLEWMQIQTHVQIQIGRVWEMRLEVCRSIEWKKMSKKTQRVMTQVGVSFHLQSAVLEVASWQGSPIGIPWLIATPGLSAGYSATICKIYQDIVSSLPSLEKWLQLPIYQQATWIYPVTPSTSEKAAACRSDSSHLRYSCSLAVTFIRRPDSNTELLGEPWRPSNVSAGFDRFSPV